jgi:hypothetical protein
MSRASAAVRFADGTVKFALYNGTADIVVPGLFDTEDEAWDSYGKRGETSGPASFPPAMGQPEDAEFFTQYGGGFRFPVKATRNCVIGPLFFDDFADAITDGDVEWWPKPE